MNPALQLNFLCTCSFCRFKTIKSLTRCAIKAKHILFDSKVYHYYG